MKLYTVSMKRAIAKCHQEDAPELSLPPFRSSYRFVNTMINQGNDMEMLKNMMFAMSMSMNQDNSESNYQNDYDMSDFFNDRMDNYRTNNAMSQFKQMFNSYRSKRQASRRQGPRPAARQTGDNLDLGDRLVEKLAEQKRHMEEKIGNMTCVLKEINALDASNNIDIQ